jgi:hypothetical protein
VRRCLRISQYPVFSRVKEHKPRKQMQSNEPGSAQHILEGLSQCVSLPTVGSQTLPSERTDLREETASVIYGHVDGCSVE